MPWQYNFILYCYYFIWPSRSSKRQQVDSECGHAWCLGARAGEVKVGTRGRCARLSGACGDSMHLCMHLSTTDVWNARNSVSVPIILSNITRMCSHGELCHFSLESFTFTRAARVWVVLCTSLYAYITRKHACDSFTLSLLTMLVQAFAWLRWMCEDFSSTTNRLIVIVGSSDRKTDRSSYRAAFSCPNCHGSRCRASEVG